MFDLYLITEGGKGVVEAVRRLIADLPPERIAVQLRDKECTTAELLRTAAALRVVTRDRGVRLLVNDRADVALAVEADGVHLPERGLPVAAARQILDEGALVGVSRHDAGGLARAADDGASFAVVGPWAAVPGKGDGIGAAVFEEITRAANIPVLALGGVTPALAGATLRAGASGVAVMRGVFRAPDPAAAATAYLRALDTARTAGG